MRILIITSLFPRDGHETLAPFNRQQFAALARVHEVAVLAPVAWTAEVRDLARGRRTARHALRADGIEAWHPCSYFPPGLFRSTYGPWYLASIGRTARRLVTDFRPDVVLGCWAHPDGWAAVRVARAAGVPCVIKVVGSDVLVVGRSGRRRAAVSGALRGSAGVVAVGRDLADNVAALGVPPANVHVVPEGLDGSLFHPGDRGEARARLGVDDPDAPLILFVGNLLLGKGVGTLLEALGALARRGTAFRCLLVGGGRDEARLRAQSTRLGLDDRVRFVGRRPHAELGDWHRAADLVTLPSHSEGTPNVLREAAACGRPIVATDVGGIPETVQGASARLVPPRDPAALADALVAAMTWGDRPPVPWISWDESAGLLADVLAAARDVAFRATSADLAARPT